MKFAGVIAEYNPFHSGHAMQLAMLRAQGAETIAVCMSSGAVQRGEIPMLPEAVRVQAALAAGADIVAALPAPYACASAEGFAAAGVRILSALGCDTLAFGAETPDAAALMQAAALLQSADFSMQLRSFLDDGLPFAAARSSAAEWLMPGAGKLLQAPNNILAVEYCKAMLTQGTAMQPLPLPRLGASHSCEEAAEYNGTPLAPAGYLRKIIRDAGIQGLAKIKPYLPQNAYGLYAAAADRGELADSDKFSTAILALLRTKTPQQLKAMRGMGEGLENRLAAALRTAATVDELYAALATKRYPHARLRRLVLDAALATPPLVQDGRALLPPYIHILGAKKAAMPLLKNAALPVSTSLAELEKSDAQSAAIAALHIKTVDFSSLCRQKTMPMGLAYTAKPVIT